MVYYSHSIIQQIKVAVDEAALKDIIDTSLNDLQSKRRNSSNAKRSFILNMIMALRYIKAEGLLVNESDNVNAAIRILEALRRQEFENLF